MQELHVLLFLSSLNKFLRQLCLCRSSSPRTHCALNSPLEIRIAKVQNWRVAKSLFALILNTREKKIKEVLCRKEIKIDESNLFEASHALPISVCKKECKQVLKKALKRKRVGIIGMAKKGLKKVGDVQFSALPYP